MVQGAAAVLFSNKPKMVRRAKYVLANNYRVHLASRDPAYKCIWFGPDEDGNNGVYLGKDVVNEASRALSMAMFKVAPSILTASQIASYAATELKRKVSSHRMSVPWGTKWRRGPEIVKDFCGSSHWHFQPLPPPV